MILLAVLFNLIAHQRWPSVIAFWPVNDTLKREKTQTKHHYEREMTPKPRGKLPSYTPHAFRSTPTSSKAALICSFSASLRNITIIANRSIEGRAVT